MSGVSFWDTLTDFTNNHGSTLAGIGGIAGALDNANDMYAMGHAQQDYLTNLGNQLNDGSQFQGYGVTSNLGTTNVAADGSISGAGLGPSGQWGNGISNTNTGMQMIQSAAGTTGGQSAMDWNSAGNNMMDMMGNNVPNHGAWNQQALGLANQSQNVNPNHGAFGQAAQTARDLSLADPSQRQGEIFDQIMAIQNPELNRHQASQMAQEHAMGRGGVMGSQYGGTSGDAAMARARAQAGNEAAFQSMQQADAERKMFGDMASQYGQVSNQNYNIMSDRESALNNAASQFGQIGNQNWANMQDRENALGMLGAQYGQLGNQANANANDRMNMLGQLGSSLSQLGLDQSQLAYLPMEMQMKLLDMGRTNSELAQSGQHTGLSYLAQLGLGGSTANLNAQQIGSQLEGNLYNALLSNIGGAESESGSLSGVGGMLDGGLDLLRSLFD
ncbi:hypothetical protein N9L28_05775 [Luminiphilus sp.]|nr:hypothetical protein [Luminiphilus sp.]